MTLDGTTQWSRIDASAVAGSVTVAGFASTVAPDLTGTSIRGYLSGGDNACHPS